MTPPLIRITNLNAWYGDSQALFGLDMEVARGETVAILGRNGAGKSTTLKSVMGIVERRSGQILVDSADLMARPRHQIARSGLGYVPENRGIFASLTVEENLELLPRIGAAQYSTEEIYEVFPNLHERRRSLGTQLSGGEQQMLALARVLRAGASILLLDEPTEGLAPVIVQSIGQILRALKARGLTILLVEQNYRFTIELADRFYLLETGRVVGSFGRAEAEANSKFVDEILGV